MAANPGMVQVSAARKLKIAVSYSVVLEKMDFKKI